MIAHGLANLLDKLHARMALGFLARPVPSIENLAWVRMAAFDRRNRWVIRAHMDFTMLDLYIRKKVCLEGKPLDKDEHLNIK